MVYKFTHNFLVCVVKISPIHEDVVYGWYKAMPLYIEKLSIFKHSSSFCFRKRQKIKTGSITVLPISQFKPKPCYKITNEFPLYLPFFRCHDSRQTNQ